ncbi:hypothetical protein D2V93_07180 [Flagellimonas taeanensis]|uniref:hypothetical protein n=1 Tax=Flavobacteriaceae TaxID=49546 RepID=UPI000E6A7575|nr:MULTISPECIES: hypothetical protein [Allomuricauda]MDC6387012.1 hypothetical protein [Muricauda sp. SK9]RIV51504.1 hypothetical protein D2V93_07180 [Allomuricauda taeanensis]
MKFYIIFIGLIGMGLHLCRAQVKIGDNLQTIDGSSLLELESTSKTLVLTRVNLSQMNTISPLNGAMVYNTDANCVFVFDGLTWKNLCGAGISVTTSALAPSGSQIGDIWIDSGSDVVSVWDGAVFVPIGSNPKSGNGSPSPMTVTNANAGDIYVDRTTGDLFTYDGAQWIIQGNGIVATNGLTETTSNNIELGGTLTKPTLIETDNTNTLAITGLSEDNDPSDMLVTVNGTTGVLGKTSRSSLVQRQESVIVASNGQSQFITPMTITDAEKIDVYRNGIKIGFSVVNGNTIELDPNATCFQDDEIRIVQVF